MERGAGVRLGEGPLRAPQRRAIARLELREAAERSLAEREISGDEDGVPLEAEHDAPALLRPLDPDLRGQRARVEDGAGGIERVVERRRAG